MTDQGEQPDDDQPDRAQPQGDDQGILAGLPRSVRWVPVVVVVVAVVLFELLAPDTFRGEEGSLGGWGYAAGLGLLLGVFLVAIVVARRSHKG